MNSPLARLIPQQMNAEQVKRDGWREHRILVVAENDERLGWVDREFIRQIGERLYGDGEAIMDAYAKSKTPESERDKRATPWRTGRTEDVRFQCDDVIGEAA